MMLPDFEDLQSELENAQEKMQDRKDELQQDLEELDQYEEDVQNRLEADELSSTEEQELRQELSAIQNSQQEKKDKIAVIQKQQQEIAKQERELSQALNTPIPTQSENPSIASTPRQLNQDQERVTQWVRSTYPYADAFRAPLRAWLEQWAPKSGAADHFTKWSNRYTLIKAWQFRSGYRYQKSGVSGQWKKLQEPLRMFVMRDAFDAEQARKGREPWTTSSDTGKQAAEEYFTLLGFAHREFDPLFSTVIYPAATDAGLTAYAQAIFYNGNQQQMSTGSSTAQPRLGWDTLNWDPAVRIPEWGAPPLSANAKWPWEIFDLSGTRHAVKVKLNWQAKLMPVTTQRLTAASQEISGDTRKNVEFAAEYFHELGTH